MLVLTRKHQEKIRIGDNIVITVLRMKGNAVRLGIEAPVEIPVIRGELVFENTPAKSNRVPAQKGICPSRSGAIHSGATWPTGSASPSAGDSRKSDPRISLQRIPRDEVREALPRILSGERPLRTVMEQRSTVL